MENSSKALIIAGAVLTSILLVATGVQVYNSTGKGASEQANQASEKMWGGVDLGMGLAGGSEGGNGGSGEDKVYLGMKNEETDSGIGYYVKMSDGQYGVIYADLAYRRTNSQWVNSNGAYSYEAENDDDLKKYFFNGTYDPEDEFGIAWGEKPLLVVDEEINETEGRTINRFYVMSLTDFTANGYTTFSWDGWLYGYGDGTYDSFGAGQSNTNLLINNDIEWCDSDIWKYLTSSELWCVPSLAELAAFFQEFGIKSENRQDYGLRSSYLVSSCPRFFAWTVTLDPVDIYEGTSPESVFGSVRLRATY